MSLWPAVGALFVAWLFWATREFLNANKGTREFAVLAEHCAILEQRLEAVERNTATRSNLDDRVKKLELQTELRQ